MTKLLPLIALIILFASCTRGYGLLNKASEKVKKSVCIFSEKSAEEMKCQKSLDEDNGQPASAAGKLSGISNWDARMLLQ